MLPAALGSALFKIHSFLSGVFLILYNKRLSRENGVQWLNMLALDFISRFNDLQILHFNAVSGVQLFYIITL